MRDDERIAKLQALLARIRSRSRAARAPGTPYSARAQARSNGLEPSIPPSARIPSAPPHFEAPPLTAPPPPEPPPARPLSPLPPIWTKHAARPELPSGLFTMPRPRPSGVHAIDPPPMEVIELEIDPDPSLPPPSLPPPSMPETPASGAGADLEATLDELAPVEADRPSASQRTEARFESRSRLVSAAPVSLAAFEPLEAPEPPESLESLDVFEPHDATHDPLPHLPSDPTIEVAAVEVSRAELDALEAEPTPSSSRRPISMDEKMNALDDDVPLYAAPPESGPLPAASPTFDLSFVEPTFAEIDIPAPAVRAALAPVAHASPLTSAGGDVAVFVGAAPSGATPTTFGELLDDALSI